MNRRQTRRVNLLYKLGLIYNGDSFVFKDINFHWTDTLCMENDEFDKAYEQAVARKKILDEEIANGN